MGQVRSEVRPFFGNMHGEITRQRVNINHYLDDVQINLHANPKRALGSRLK